MKNVLRLFVFTIALLVSSFGFTQENPGKFVYKSQAGKTIAPVLEEGTTVLVRLNLKEADVDKVADYIEKFVEYVTPKLRMDKDEADAMLETFKEAADENVKKAKDIIGGLIKANADEVFIIFNANDMNEMNNPVFLVPVGNKTKEETDAIRKSAAKLDNMKLTFVRHGFIWAIPTYPWNEDKVWDYVGKRFAKLDPKPFPGVDEAFLEFEKERTSAQLIVMLPESTEETFEMARIKEEDLERMARYNPEGMTEIMKNMIEPQAEIFDALLEGYRWGGIGLSLEKPGATLIVQMKDDKTAKALYQGTKEILDPFKRMMALTMSEEHGMMAFAVAPMAMIFLGDGAMQEIDGEPKDGRITLKIDESNSEKLLASLDEQFKILKEQADVLKKKSRCRNNLKELVLAFHNYHDTHSNLPPAYTVDDEGKPLHSWRVLILPFLEEQELYEKIKLDEPWDSEHNKQFHSKMPEVFQCIDRVEAEIAAGKKVDPSLTDYVLITGKDAVFDKDKEPSFADITDGLSNTLGIVEAKTPVCWMAPLDITQEDAEKGINKSPKGIGSVHEGGANGSRLDGSVFFMKDSMKKETIKGGVSRSGGESVELY